MSACSKAPKKSTLAAHQTATGVPAPAAAATVAAAPHVGVSTDLAAQCRLTFENRAEAPKFDFDRFQLLTEDRDILEQVAECLTRGPLHGKSVKLVGRADPRGTDEYNLGLGTRRAESVSEYLQRLGVPAAQLQAVTKGDLDAIGTDEVGWREDRRVDLALKD